MGAPSLFPAAGDDALGDVTNARDQMLGQGAVACLLNAPSKCAQAPLTAGAPAPPDAPAVLMCEDPCGAGYMTAQAAPGEPSCQDTARDAPQAHSRDTSTPLSLSSLQPQAQLAAAVAVVRECMQACEQALQLAPRLPQEQQKALAEAALRELYQISDLISKATVLASCNPTPSPNRTTAPAAQEHRQQLQRLGCHLLACIAEELMTCTPETWPAAPANSHAALTRVGQLLHNALDALRTADELTFSGVVRVVGCGARCAPLMHLLLERLVSWKAIEPAVPLAARLAAVLQPSQGMPLVRWALAHAAAAPLAGADLDEALAATAAGCAMAPPAHAAAVAQELLALGHTASARAVARRAVQRDASLVQAAAVMAQAARQLSVLPPGDQGAAIGAALGCANAGTLGGACADMEEELALVGAALDWQLQQHQQQQQAWQEQQRRHTVAHSQQGASKRRHQAPQSADRFVPTLTLLAEQGALPNALLRQALEVAAPSSLQAVLGWIALVRAACSQPFIVSRDEDDVTVSPGAMAGAAEAAVGPAAMAGTAETAGMGGQRTAADNAAERAAALVGAQQQLGAGLMNSCHLWYSSQPSDLLCVSMALCDAGICIEQAGLLIERYLGLLADHPNAESTHCDQLFSVLQLGFTLAGRQMGGETGQWLAKQLMGRARQLEQLGLLPLGAVGAADALVQGGCCVPVQLPGVATVAPVGN